MAHVGKDYPVAFRRDLSLQVSRNVFYWAKYYRFYFNWSAGPVGGHMRDVDWGRLEPQFTPATGECHLRSGIAIVNAHSVYFDVESFITGNPQIYQTHYRCFRSDDTLLFEQIWEQGTVQQYTRREANGDSSVIFQTPDLYFGAGQNFDHNGMVAVTWPEI